ncbi:MAG: RecB family exonuclease [Acidimicrobiia bacterium]
MIESPPYLSPSSIGTFRDCPMKFKFSKIDRISEPPTWATHLGTFVHEVLEHFYQLDAHERTTESVKAMATERWKVSDWESRVLALDKPEGGVIDFKRSAIECINNLWKVEEPTTTELVGMEHEVEADIDGVRMKGYIDRFTFDDEGSIIISDYKTGKVPNPKFKSEDDKFFQLVAYALMMQEADQETTSKLQLLYLKTGQKHEMTLTPVKLNIARGVIVETKELIDAACASGDFSCKVTKLCDWCFFKPQCPAHA